jgi:hypothetical protein
VLSYIPIPLARDTTDFNADRVQPPFDFDAESVQPPTGWGERVCITCPSCIPDTQPTWVRQCSDCFRDDSTRRPCRVCEKPRIPVTEPAWKQVCGHCFRDAAMRPCSACKEYKIKSFDPEWRTLCKECYSEKKWKRTCTRCKERPIKDDMPSYILNCTKCYLEEKRMTHSMCPTCVGPRAKQLTRRNGSPMCRECMLGKGLIRTMDMSE